MTDTPPDEPTEPTDTPPPAADGGGGDGERVSVQLIEIQDEMERSFLEYAMSVIMARALPDARDGLKPVHRRILWSMINSGFTPNRAHVKCSRVVGDVMANFHPHGDSAIYDALVRMAQPFSLRDPLIDFHGNYGSPEFGPAASRYTECRLSPLAMRPLAAPSCSMTKAGKSWSMMPGVSARAQLIRFDAAGVAVSAGAACSSGTLKTSPVLKALGWDDKAADEVIRVSFGPQTSEANVAAFLTIWRGMAKARAA